MRQEIAADVCDTALAALEQIELRSLSWGFVDVSSSESEVEAAIVAALTIAQLQADWKSVLEALVEQQTVRTFYGADERRYRTRIAELVRLLVRSRQLFPQRTWQTSPTLVSDFRIDIRHRRYPKRNINHDDALKEIENASLNALQRALWKAFTGTTQKLSRFQIDAFRRILTPGEGGTIITAGTGSGKTLAFYFPAMLAIAPTLRSNENCVRIVSIYPRQELLKDQLSEAYRLGRAGVPILVGSQRRPMSFGALYHATPRTPSDRELEEKGWRKRGVDFICPSIRCPTCDGQMKWARSDLEDRVERLSCVQPGCSGAIEPETIRLTRDSIRKTPPDILFTTTEMLNQRLSDAFNRHIFGVGQPKHRQPKFILLDEVHTYSGTSGAQAALVFRRWRHLLSTPVRWVGLSATLRHAEEFFADLTGLYQDSVVEITPHLEDMEAEGAEYQILLRSDPSWQNSTLSTSIQAAMLIARTLDPRQSVSAGRFGRRLFVFTDDLDVTHRMFDDLRDAEAYNKFGKPDPARLPLASLRATGRGDEEIREQFGQRWALAESLRGSLDTRLVIGRTTSRDPGVDGTADVIVATAALEVGFNDPEVGAVLQHKAPRSVASYLQRRGRAGRNRNMRPITVTVLSDYGRDRVSFQSYEYLFDPILDREILPVRNSYVLRIQAIFATLDWLTERLAERGVKGWAWGSLSTAPNASFDDRAYRDGALSFLRKLIEADDLTLRDLSQYLERSLGLEGSLVNALLWEPPRSILLEAIPTLVRRLYRDWQLASGDGLDLNIPFHPLPDFVSRNLFQELSLPEVTIVVPPATTRDTEHEESLSVGQALSQFAPGRVRRRFADEYGGLAHWISIPTDSNSVDICVDDYASDVEYVGTFPATIGGRLDNIDVYRPWRMSISKVPPNAVLHSSNSTWSWLSYFERTSEGLSVSVPEYRAWSSIISSFECLLHRFASSLSISRYAMEGLADIRVRHQQSYVHYRMIDSKGRPAGLGFTFEADAILIQPQLPSLGELATKQLPDAVIRWLRFLRFSDMVRKDDLLPSNINFFQRDWLTQAFLVSALAKAEQSGVSLTEAIRFLRDKEALSDFTAALSAIVSGAVVEEGQGTGTQLERTLRSTLETPGVIRRLGELAEASLNSSGSEWAEWLLALFLSTLAQAALQACLIAAPANTAVEGLAVDVCEIGQKTTIAISETTVGGGGTIEALGHGFSLEPQAFFRALEAALAPTDLELAADGLQRIYTMICSDSELEVLLTDLRAATDQGNRLQAKNAFIRSLASKGLQVSQTLSVSIGTRLLRPGMSSDADRLVNDLLEGWNALEKKHAIAFPIRIAAALLATGPTVRDRLVLIGGQGNEVGTSNLLLWARGGEVRQHSLETYSPYRAPPCSDSAAVRALLPDTITIVDMSDASWRQQFGTALIQQGTVRLTTASDALDHLRTAVVELVGMPIEVDSYHFYPTVEAYRSLPNEKIGIDLTLRERV